MQPHSPIVLWGAAAIGVRLGLQLLTAYAGLAAPGLQRTWKTQEEEADWLESPSAPQKHGHHKAEAARRSWKEEQTFWDRMGMSHPPLFLRLLRG